METFTSSMTDEAKPQREGKVARAIERTTAKLPSDLFLWTAGLSVLASLVLQIIGMRRASVREEPMPHTAAPLATFVGMWVPSLLLLGVYSKIVMAAGPDRPSR
jgi:hypothetical protein